MAASNYKACFDLTLKWEGGYVNHPKDPGGATNRGVIQRVYDAYRKRRGLGTRSVRHIEDAEVREIYRKQYWNAVRGDDLPPGVDLAVWDFGVNSGPKRSIQFLQRIVGVRVDGDLGEATLAAIETFAPGDLAKKLCDARQAWLRRLPTFSTFGTGWTRRVNSIRAASIKMAAELPHKPVVVATPEPVEDVGPPMDLTPHAPETAPQPAPKATVDEAEIVEEFEDHVEKPAIKSKTNWAGWFAGVSTAATAASGFFSSHTGAIVFGGLALVSIIVVLVFHNRIIQIAKDFKEIA